MPSRGDGGFSARAGTGFMGKKTGVFRRLRNSGKRQSFCPQTCSPSRRDTAPDSSFKPSNGARGKSAAAPPLKLTRSIFARLKTKPPGNPRRLQSVQIRMSHLIISVPSLLHYRSRSFFTSVRLIRWSYI